MRKQRIESKQRRRDELRDGYCRLKDVLSVSSQKSSKVSLLDRGELSFYFLSLLRPSALARRIIGMHLEILYTLYGYTHKILLQYVVDAFSQYATLEDFWVVYSLDGKRLTWTQLRRQLMNQRIDRDREQAAAARRKYGDLAQNPAFSYMKANTRRDMTSDKAIARIYRQLEGICSVCRIKLSYPGS